MAYVYETEKEYNSYRHRVLIHILYEENKIFCEKYDPRHLWDTVHITKLKNDSNLTVFILFFSKRENVSKIV